MTDPTFIPLEGRELLAVYSDRAAALDAAGRIERQGVDPGLIHVDEETDEVTSLRAEMHDELTHAWVVPNAAFIATKESVKGSIAFGAIATAVCLVVAIPLAFVDFASTLGPRLVLAVALSAGVGLAVGLVAGAASTAKRPNELSAAQRGYVVRVERDTPELRGTLAELEPIRLDAIDHEGNPIIAITTEEEATPQAFVEEIRANATADDYHPAHNPERSADRPRPKQGR